MNEVPELKRNVNLDDNTLDQIAFKWLAHRAKTTPNSIDSYISGLINAAGHVGTYFQRGDVESHLGRELTDEEWDNVQDDFRWRHMVDGMCEVGNQVCSDIAHDFSWKGN